MASISSNKKTQLQVVKIFSELFTCINNLHSLSPDIRAVSEQLLSEMREEAQECSVTPN